MGCLLKLDAHRFRMLWPHHLLLLLMVVVMEASSEVILPNCTTTGTTVPTVDTSVNASCTSVVFSNVVLQGSMMLNISIAGMVMANPTAPSIVVTLSNVTLQSGATLAIDSRGAAEGVPSVSILIQSLSGSDGCLVFLGSFPRRTSILVSRATMLSSSVATPTHPALDPYYSEFRSKIVMLVNLSLAGRSSLIFEGSSFVGRVDDTIAMYITGAAPTTLSSGSLLSFKNCSILAANGSAFHATASLSFANSSALSISFCRVGSEENFGAGVFSLYKTVAFSYSSCLVVTSSTFGGLARWGPSFLMDNLVHFLSQSYLAISSCLFNAGFRIYSGVFADGSYLQVTACNMTSSSFFGGFGVFDAVFTRFSSMTLASCNFSLESDAVLLGNTSFVDYSAMVIASTTIVSSHNGVGVLMMSTSFANFSSMTVTSCSLTSPISAFGGFKLNLSESSSWTFMRCRFSSLFVAYGFSDGTVSINSNSSWKIDQCSFSGSVCIGFAAASIRLLNRSTWEVTDCTFHASGFVSIYAAVTFSSLSPRSNISNFRPTLELLGMSALSFSRCTFAAVAASSLLQLSGVDVLVEKGSSWSINDCTGASGGTGGSVVFSASTITIQQSSEFKILRSAFTATSSPCLSFSAKSMINVRELSVFVVENGTLQGSLNALTLSVDSTIQVEGISAWVISGMILSSSSGSANNPAVAVHLKGAISVTGSSLLALRANVLHLPSSSAESRSCIVVGIVVALGSVQFTENDCSGVFSDGAAFVASTEKQSSFVERCNSVNGAVWRPSAADGMSSLPCGRCDRTVDCFWPLTEPVLFTRMQCGGARSCPCIKSCGGQEDLMCLPGTGTMAGTATSSECTLNSVNRPKLRTTMTMSANATRSATSTRSRSQQEPDEIDHLVATAVLTPLGTATVAFASSSVLLSGPVGAGMMQRMQAQQLLNSCGRDFTVDFSSSPTQMRFGSTDDDNKAYVRGAVVGNLIVWLLCILFACGLATIAQLRRAARGADTKGEGSWSACAADLGLPGVLNWPYIMLNVPTVMLSIMLLVPSRVTGGGAVRPADAVVGVIGCIVCLAGAACKIFLTTRQPFQAIPLERNVVVPAVDTKPSGVPPPPSLLERYKRLMEADLLNRWEWVDRKEGSGFVRRWGAVFMFYRNEREWFEVIDLPASILVAVLAGLVPLDQGDGGICGELQALSAIVAVAFFGSLVLLRPHGSPMLRRFATCNAAITAVSSVLGACGVDTAVLTAVQAFLNGISTIALFGILLLGGVALQSLLFLVAIIAGSVPKDKKAKTSRGADGWSSGLLATATTQRLQPINPDMLQRIAAGVPPTPTEQKWVLEELICIICETQNSPQLEHLL